MGETGTPGSDCVTDGTGNVNTAYNIGFLNWMCQHQTATAVASVAVLAAMVAELVIWYNKFDDQIEKRDEIIDLLMTYVQYLHDKTKTRVSSFFNVKNGAMAHPTYTIFSANEGFNAGTLDVIGLQRVCGATTYIEEETTLHMLPPLMRSGIRDLNYWNDLNSFVKSVDQQISIVLTAHGTLKNAVRPEAVLSLADTLIQLHHGFASFFMQAANTTGVALGTSLHSMSETANTIHRMSGKTGSTGA